MAVRHGGRQSGDPAHFFRDRCPRDERNRSGCRSADGDLDGGSLRPRSGVREETDTDESGCGGFYRDRGCLGVHTGRKLCEGGSEDTGARGHRKSGLTADPAERRADRHRIEGCESDLQRRGEGRVSTGDRGAGVCRSGRDGRGKRCGEGEGNPNRALNREAVGRTG